MEMQQRQDEEQHLNKQRFEVMEKGTEYLENDEKIDIIEETMVTQVDMCRWLDLQNMAGLTPKKALKLWGNLGNQQVTVLEDSGATHYYNSQNLVKNMRVPI